MSSGELARHSQTQCVPTNLPVPDVASPFAAAGSGTVTAILARSLAGMPRVAVTGRVKPPGGRKLSLIA